jgi:hypothetical protein
MALILRGPAAELRVGYETAACLGRWELTRTATGFTLEAPVIHRNLHWLTAGYPLDLCLSVGKSVWRFKDVVVAGDNPVHIQGEGRPEVST